MIPKSYQYAGWIERFHRKHSLGPSLVAIPIFSLSMSYSDLHTKEKFVTKLTLTNLSTSVSN